MRDGRHTSLHIEISRHSQPTARTAAPRAYWAVSQMPREDKRLRLPLTYVEHAVGTQEHDIPSGDIRHTPSPGRRYERAIADSAKR